MIVFPKIIYTKERLRRYYFVVTLVFGLLLLAAIILRINVGSLRATFALGSLPLLFLAPLWILLAHFIAIARWKVFLLAAGYHISFLRLCVSFFANLPAAKFFPSYSGDLLRVVYVADVVPHAFHFGVIGTEALLDIVALLLIVMFGATFSGMYTVAIGAFLALCIGVLLVFSLHHFALRLAQYFPSVLRALDAFKVLKRNPFFGILLLALSVSGWFCTAFFILQLFIAFGVSVSLGYILLVQPMVTIVSLLPITLGGIGVREGAMLFLYGGVVSAHIILAVGTYYSFVSVILFSLLSLPVYFVVSRNLDKRAIGV